jgi:hypothetical protein
MPQWEGIDVQLINTDGMARIESRSVAPREDLSPAVGAAWAVPFLIRRCAYHMSFTPEEMQDRDLSLSL